MPCDNFSYEFDSGVHKVSQLCTIDMPERITRAAARAIKSFIGEVTFGMEMKETGTAPVKVKLNACKVSAVNILILCQLVSGVGQHHAHNTAIQ